ncbi:Dabb family protein [Peptostreptococcus canis]|uniref:Stress-response A/B barrel domain-containing protein n=1 Tax=Peptostreptococcus canis TaxID=1159213 RepID=A0ABR6TKI2_9FIRM|nr:Dabb family protein [Peptostreptococcus canis]MBC2575694.1 hypothetical protein [Peptostreptococcus canis]MBP1998955.1 hypothetical protein [Peptostreptococcus canis]
MRHIVLFKFNEKKSVEILSEDLVKIYDNLRDKYKVIKEYDYKINVLEKDSNMDLILFIDIEDKNKLDDYLLHPEHLMLLDKIKSEGIISKAVIDID